MTGKPYGRESSENPFNYMMKLMTGCVGEVLAERLTKCGWLSFYDICRVIQHPSAVKTTIQQVLGEEAWSKGDKTIHSYWTLGLPIQWNAHKILFNSPNNLCTLHYTGSEKLSNLHKFTSFEYIQTKVCLISKPSLFHCASLAHSCLIIRITWWGSGYLLYMQIPWPLSRLKIRISKWGVGNLHA